jgi:hypothetical protein
MGIYLVSYEHESVFQQPDTPRAMSKRSRRRARVPSNNRRELIATCQRGGRRSEVALLDIDIHTDATTSRLIAAYHRWTGD